MHFGVEFNTRNIKCRLQIKNLNKKLVENTIFTFFQQKNINK